MARTPGNGAQWQVNDELANKVAEITVLRQRMQQIERENVRLETELAQAKERGTAMSSSQKSREKVDLERANEQVQYLRQDLLSSEDERKRLKLTLQSQEQELLALRQRAEAAQATQATQAPAPRPPEEPPKAPAAESRPPPAATSAPAAPAECVGPSEPQRGDEAKGQLLLCELVRWETLSEQPRDAWYQLRAAVSRFPGADAARAAGTAAVQLLRSTATPAARRQAARALRMWLGLFPSHAREIAAAALPNEGFFDALGAMLHAVQSEDKGEILPFLLVFQEAVSKLKSHELGALKPLLQGGTLRGLLLEEPTEDSLHLPCLRLLEALMASPELFGMAHQAESQENVLLAAADLLVLPSVAEGRRDSLERQKCRVAALRIFSRCCATASLDFVLPLRAEEGMDTVLQSLVLLCHHELLCLLMYGNPWRSEDLEESRRQRLQAVETSLFLLASLAWHLSPLKDGLEGIGSSPRPEPQFGRTQVLLPSIVDMVSSNESLEDFQPFLSSISAIRLLIEEPASASAPSIAS